MKKSIIAFSILLTAGFAGNALAGQVTCASSDGKYKECRVDDSGDIVMKQQLSKTACVKDKTWGETADGVYVKGGCRAIFETMSMNQSQNTGGGGSGYQDLIGAKAAGGESDLQSRGYTWVRTTTQSNSKLSFWRKPNNSGCIQVTTSDGRYSAIRDVNTSQCAQGGGSSANTGISQVTCTSTGGKYVECPIPGGGNIVMKQQLSKAACIKNQSWGETSEGVYVKDGCRAIFESR